MYRLPFGDFNHSVANRESIFDMRYSVAYIDKRT